MDQLKIEGGHSLKGEVRISGAKNAALPVLAATILTGGPFHIDNCPRLRDINTFLTLLKGLGVHVAEMERPLHVSEGVYYTDKEVMGGLYSSCTVDTQDAHCQEREWRTSSDRSAKDIGKDGYKYIRTLHIDSSDLSGLEAAYDLVRTMRASILVLGPLVARAGKARISLPGGCAIGARPIDLHLKGLEKMGARLKLKGGYVEASASRLKGTEIYLDTPTVTGTENLMMAATLAKGKTVLKNAAREPEVVHLGEMLNLMGARISGLGTPTITIEGVNDLRPVAWRIIPDRIETGTYMMAVGAAGGELTLKDVRAEHLQAVISKLRCAGLQINASGDQIFVKKKGRLQSVDIKTLPYPGFPTDLQAQIMVLMSMAEGLSVITETIFENRFMHVAELQRLGADIKVEGRSAIVRGVKELNGAPVMATDLRASASLVLAGLAAKGITTILRVYHLDRGYEDMEGKLSAVGARIKRERIDIT
ncbi:MAG: UDP-N-acetylglucosamine 1-carboxyvinyltransferase [Dissulfurimicrobium sp.]|uniref:UDP-N-acetylglucosamine 1-carboxyvinyltransferase n=1 Tax=Dissulfurimicrobium TaxID=1769732 RepID=UPI001EDA78BC|nr:UDP-N-acetylglucosamine 1-carboxyvinyltransferase [Dissulfurimicrobium hydrothermale]UKL13835.1 UDP-N-acetylglucosamine 1-carboxyvinyltransferase [Dissulfurimicrobium hydrothermale]